jgi:hypothetical protein
MLHGGADATLVSVVRNLQDPDRTVIIAPFARRTGRGTVARKALPGSRWHKQMEEPLRLLASVSPSGLSSWSVATGGFSGARWRGRRPPPPGSNVRLAMCGAGGCCGAAVVRWCGGAVVRWCRYVPLGGRVARTESERESERERQTKRPPGYAQSSHSLPPILLSTLLLLSLPYNHASPSIESQYTSLTSLLSIHFSLRRRRLPAWCLLRS